MIKASALYLVIIIALIIALLCSSLVVVGFYYRQEYMRKNRSDRLINNLNSGVTLLLAGNDTSYSNRQDYSLYDDGQDSVKLQKSYWGIYDIGIVKAFIQTDTLSRAFSIACNVDTTNQPAIYLKDEGSPLAVSGNASITGDAYLPSSGVQPAYLDNKGYTGKKQIVNGHIFKSAKVLPALDSFHLLQLESLFAIQTSVFSGKLPDTLENSFFMRTRYLNLGQVPRIISHQKVAGNIVIRCDTSIVIDSTAELSDVIIYARSIVVKSGFRGHCQLFARDSIRVMKDCSFSYPSSLAIIRFEDFKMDRAPKIRLDSMITLQGAIFTYEKFDNRLKAGVDMGKNVTIEGTVYTNGEAALNGSSKIFGSIYTGNFAYRANYTYNRNYLVDAEVNPKLRSPYFLISPLFPGSSVQQKILQWLD